MKIPNRKIRQQNFLLPAEKQCSSLLAAVRRNASYPKG
jgi:hypothetical protein